MQPINQIFFIVYDARSGSTFLANQLMHQTAIAIPPESNFIAHVLEKYPKQIIESQEDLAEVLSIIFQEKKFSDWQITKEEIIDACIGGFPLSIGDLILSICALYRNKNFPEATQFGIKKGNMGRYHLKIRQAIPGARFIVLVRDGRGVFNSQKESRYSETGQPMQSDPVAAASRWSEMSSLIREIETSYPTDTLRIKYEDMMTDVDSTLGRVFQFLRIEKSLERRSQEYVVPQRYDVIHRNISKGPIKERIDAWKQSLSAGEILAYESAAGEWLVREGYTLINNAYRLSSIRLKKKILRKLGRLHARLTVKA